MDSPADAHFGSCVAQQTSFASPFPVACANAEPTNSIARQHNRVFFASSYKRFLLKSEQPTLPTKSLCLLVGAKYSAIGTSENPSPYCTSRRKYTHSQRLRWSNKQISYPIAKNRIYSYRQTELITHGAKKPSACLISNAERCTWMNAASRSNHVSLENQQDWKICMTYNKHKHCPQTVHPVLLLLLF